MVRLIFNMSELSKKKKKYCKKENNYFKTTNIIHLHGNIAVTTHVGLLM